MVIERFLIEGLIKITPKTFADERGYFMETFQDERYQAILPHAFFQDNVSLSRIGVVRGLHFQVPPFAQAKLVQVFRGRVLDVAVDLRKNSPTYGQHQCVELSEDNRVQFYIPVGFAHGFMALEANTLFHYKCSERYTATHERTLHWNDPQLGISWPEGPKIVAEKDQHGLPLTFINSPF